jgi:hypothetical protein
MRPRFLPWVVAGLAGRVQADLAASPEAQSSGIPFKTGCGMFAKYGQAPSAEEIDANRADMFRNFGEDH